MRPIRTFILSIALIASWATNAQVKVDAEIILQGIGIADKQVTGLDSTTEENAALQAGIEQDGTHKLALSSANDWNVTINGSTGPPTVGMQLVLRTPLSIPGAVELLVNGHGPFPVRYGPDQPVDGDDFQVSTFLSVVFDGNAFQVMNGTVNERRNCPTATVAVTDQFCIANELFLGNPMTFFDAIQACDSVGLRLCSWAEWYSACTVSDELNISSMSTAWEWTNDSANEDGHARWAGYQSCIARGNGPVAVPARFRCCFSR
ncbi:MAG TPA: hypothetical protein PK735_05070 [Flavobacteriales bacterium]|nr:hypothetical protein [Flavobacteriales bacterium]